MTFVTATVHERIRSVRALRGLSQRDFARAVGATQSSVWSWEAGRGNPRPSSMSKIADALKVNMLWITFGEGPMEAAKTGSEG